MSTEYQDSPEQKKRASGPKKGQEKRNRLTKRVSGYRPKARNALYQIAAEYKRRHPKATARDAWNNLCAIAHLGAHDVLTGHDPSADVLSYRPDLEKIGTRELKWRSFQQWYYRLNPDQPAQV